MKLAILSLLAIILSSQAYAQRRTTGPRYNPPGSSRTTHTRPGTIYRPAPARRTYGGPIIVGPRYNPNRDSRRIIRSVRRSPVIWSSGFGYSCGRYGELLNNGYLVHNFTFQSDCVQALRDIEFYGDFCDREDLYDQSGRLEAQFTFSSECRAALGWYY